MGRLCLRPRLAGRKLVRLFPPSSTHNTTIPIQTVSAVGVPKVWAGAAGGVAGSALFVRDGDRPSTCEPPGCVEAKLKVRRLCHHLGPFLKSFSAMQRPHAPCTMLLSRPLLIGCRLVMAVQCDARFTPAGRDRAVHPGRLVPRGHFVRQPH